MTYLKTVWLVDGIKNKLYSFEDNELQQESHTIPVINTNITLNDCKVLVSTNQKDVYVLSPTGYLFKFDTQKDMFTSTIRLSEGSSGIAQGPTNECGTTPIFVSNYNENTVSVIINDSIQYDIPVGLGPTNIIIDSNGIAYVCNSIENTISVICFYHCKYVSYKKIRLLSNPIDVCIDKKNVLYVLCKDNKVYKLVSHTSSKRLSFDVGETPSAITCDNNNNILVTNYDDGTLTTIDTNSIINTIGLTEYHPIAVDTDSDNNIFVITAHNIIIQLKDGKIVNKFYANTPSSINTLNDFTGMKTKIAISYNSDDNTGGNESVTKADLESIKTELNNKIQVFANKDAFPDPSTNTNDKSLYVDEENNTIYRLDKTNKAYKILYGASLTDIKYEDKNDTKISLIYNDGSTKELDLRGLADVDVADNDDSLSNADIDKLF